MDLDLSQRDLLSSSSVMNPVFSGHFDTSPSFLKCLPETSCFLGLLLCSSGSSLPLKDFLTA